MLNYIIGIKVHFFSFPWRGFEQRVKLRLGLLHAALPCITTRGYLHQLNAWPPIRVTWQLLPSCQGSPKINSKNTKQVENIFVIQDPINNENFELGPTSFPNSTIYRHGQIHYSVRRPYLYLVIVRRLFLIRHSAQERWKSSTNRK